MTTKNKTNASAPASLYSDIVIKPLPQSQVEIIGKIPTDIFESFRSKALKNINEEISIDGFRKGNIPEKVLVAKVGEMMILEEMSELALSAAYPAIVIDNKVDALGRPEISITKIASGNPLEFKITTAVVPKVTLADYKKLAREVNTEKADEAEKVEVTDKDLEEAVTRIRRSHAARHHTHDESHDSMSDEVHAKLVDQAMPVLDDAFVQTLGDFTSVADFNEKIRKALLEDKKGQLKEKRRITLADKISDATTVEIPAILIGSELRRIEAQFREDVTRMGVSFDDYLKHAKKTLEEIRKEWTPLAEKKAKLQIILNTIAETEKLHADPKEIEEEVGHILAHYKDADREQAYTYAETVLMNENVFKFLEGVK